MSAIHKQKIHFFEFGPFRLDAEERLLFRSSELVSLTPKVFDTLLVLIENRGRLLEKDALMNAVWPDTFVEECSLAQNISLLRKALGEEHGGRQYIETLPKRGYRFMADVREVRDEGGAFLLQRRTNSQILIEEEEETESLDNEVVSTSSVRPSSGRLLRWQRYAVISCVVLALAAALYFWQARGRKAEPGLAVKSIAVLPFKTLGVQGETELMGFGMTDALVLRLAQLDQVSVLPTSSVFKYVNREGDAMTFGRELGVDAVLDGTVQHSGDRIRVTAQLIRLRDGKTLWVGKFDEQMRDIFVVQDSVSQQLAQALSFKVANYDKALHKKRFTENAEAYELYTRGLYFWNKRTDEGLSKAIEYFKQATEKDPNYALAFAGLSDSHMLVGFYRYRNMTPDKALPDVKAAAVRAFELDPTLAEANAAMGVVNALEGDHEEAFRLYERAIELNPDLATAHLRYGYLLANRGKLDKAIHHMQRAHELDPLSATINVNLSAYYGYKGQPDLGVKYARLALETDPDSWHARVNLGESYEMKGMYEEAAAEYKILEQKGMVILAQQQLAYLNVMMGNQEEARKLLAEVEKAYHDGKGMRITAHSIAQVYVAMGQHDEAFKWLNTAAESRALILPDFGYSEKLNPIRKDPRFEALMEGIRLRQNQSQQSMVKR
jgi:DNA-binding winged helix-turn-helix (wHTH) protein/TolB-like protein/Flp pilus assembly protein TadD